MIQAIGVQCYQRHFHIEKLSYIEKVPKFIAIETNNAASNQNFIREM